MTVNAFPARNEYTGTAAQTVFNYTFKIYTDTDLDVYITPAGEDANDSANITTAYTVDPGGILDPSGGFITLNSGVNAGDLVTIVSSMPTNRTVDYQNSGDFLPDTVDNDIDRTVSLDKQAVDVATRSPGYQRSQQNATAQTIEAPIPLGYWRDKSNGTGVEKVVLDTGNDPLDAGRLGANNTWTGDNTFTEEIVGGSSISTGGNHIVQRTSSGNARLELNQPVGVGNRTHITSNTAGGYSVSSLDADGANSQVQFSASRDGASSMQYAGSTRLETTDDGIKVTGDITENGSRHICSVSFNTQTSGIVSGWGASYVAGGTAGTGTVTYDVEPVGLSLRYQLSSTLQGVGNQAAIVTNFSTSTVDTAIVSREGIGTPIDSLVTLDVWGD